MLMIIPDCCARMIGSTARIASAAASTFNRKSASTSPPAATAEIRRFPAGGQLRDPVSAAWTFLLGLAVHRHETSILFVRFILRLGLDRFDGRVQHLSGRRMQLANVV